MTLLFLASVAVAAILLGIASRLARPLAGAVAVIGLGVLAAGIVASFLDGNEGGPIVLAGGIGLVWLHRWAQRDQRRTALARFSRAHGLEFRSRAKGALDEDFRLFRRGDGRAARNLIQGRWDDLAIRALDYDYFATLADWGFYRVKRWRRVSVAILELGASVPSVVAERNGAGGLAPDYMGFHDVQLNSDEFNRRFHVIADDREFAYTFFDLGMLRWLLDQQDLLETEVEGRHALVALPRLDVQEMDRLFEVASGFRSHIPRLVRRTYHLPDPVAP